VHFDDDGQVYWYTTVRLTRWMAPADSGEPDEVAPPPAPPAPPAAPALDDDDDDFEIQEFASLDEMRSSHAYSQGPGARRPLITARRQSMARPCCLADAPAAAGAPLAGAVREVAVATSPHGEARCMVCRCLLPAPETAGRASGAEARLVSQDLWKRRHDWALAPLRRLQPTLPLRLPSAARGSGARGRLVLLALRPHPDAGGRG